MSSLGPLEGGGAAGVTFGDVRFDAFVAVAHDDTAAVCRRDGPVDTPEAMALEAPAVDPQRASPVRMRSWPWPVPRAAPWPWKQP